MYILKNDFSELNKKDENKVTTLPENFIFVIHFLT